MAEDVAEAPCQQQEAAGGEKVCVHHPDERLVGEAEVATYPRERHADDHDVEDDHHLPKADDGECPPAIVGVHGDICSYARCNVQVTMRVVKGARRSVEGSRPGS